MLCRSRTMSRLEEIKVRLKFNIKCIYDLDNFTYSDVELKDFIIQDKSGKELNANKTEIRLYYLNSFDIHCMIVTHQQLRDICKSMFQHVIGYSLFVEDQLMYTHVRDYFSIQYSIRRSHDHIKICDKKMIDELKEVDKEYRHKKENKIKVLFLDNMGDDNERLRSELYHITDDLIDDLYDYPEQKDKPLIINKQDLYFNMIYQRDKDGERFNVRLSFPEMIEVYGRKIRKDRLYKDNQWYNIKSLKLEEKKSDKEGEYIGIEFYDKTEKFDKDINESLGFSAYAVSSITCDFGDFVTGYKMPYEYQLIGSRGQELKFNKTDIYIVYQSDDKTIKVQTNKEEMNITGCWITHVISELYWKNSRYELKGVVFVFDQKYFMTNIENFSKKKFIQYESADIPYDRVILYARK